MASMKRWSALAGAPMALVGALLGGMAGGLSGCAEDDEPGEPTSEEIQLRGPLQDAYVGTVHSAASLRPQFRWSAPTAKEYEGEVDYQFELGTDPMLGTTLITQITRELSFTPSEPLPVSQVAPVGTRYYWRVRACVADRCSPMSPVRWVNVGRSPRDFNGDGYADVLVGARREGVGGKAHLYFGGAGAAFEPTANLTLVSDSPQETDLFGIATAFAGDLNGDGFADLVVGASGYQFPSQPGPGRAHIYLGRAAAAGDLTADVVLAGEPTAAYFGAAVASAGDVNGDGFSDLVVAAPSGDAGGYVYLYLGADVTRFKTTAVQRLEESLYPYLFGSSVSSAGDVNGDGYADLLVGQRLIADGKAYLYFGQAGSEGVSFDEVRRIAAPVSLSGFGTTVAGAGDLNGDGFSDLAVGSQLAAYVYLGAAGRAFDAVIDGQLQVRGANVPITSLASVGDLDGDGLADLLVGNANGSYVSNDKGVANIYYGGEGERFDSVADQELRGTAPADKFGESAAGAGDVNGDGFADVIVGVPHLRDGRAQGAARVFLSESGGALRVGATLLGPEESTEFGESVGGGPL